MFQVTFFELNWLCTNPVDFNNSKNLVTVRVGTNKKNDLWWVECHTQTRNHFLSTLWYVWGWESLVNGTMWQNIGNEIFPNGPFLQLLTGKKDTKSCHKRDKRSLLFYTFDKKLQLWKPSPPWRYHHRCRKPNSFSTAKFFILFVKSFEIQTFVIFSILKSTSV